MDVKSQVVVITGAASGIGAALAEAFGDAGARLALADRDHAGVEAVAQTLKARGVEACAYPLDVSSRAAWQALAQTTLAELGGARVLINNAGITFLGSFEATPVEDFDRVLAVNLGGVVEGCRAYLPQLREAPAARIVNISSLYGLVGVPGQTAYCASKFAVRGFSEALHEELRGTTVGVTVVHPGGIRTNIMNQAKTGGAGAEATAANIRDFFAKKTMRPGKAAGLILRAVQRDQHRLLITRESVIFDLMRRIAPEWGNRFAVDGMVKGMGLGSPKRLIGKG